MCVIIQLFMLIFVLPFGLAMASGDAFAFYIVESGGWEVSIARLTLHIFTSIRIVSYSTYAIKNIGPICFYLFIYLWIIVVPSMQMYYEEWPWDIFLPIDAHIYTFLMVAVSIVAFETGWSVGRRTRETRFLLVVPNSTMFYAAFFLYSILFVYFIIKIGDLSILLGARVNAYKDVANNSTERLVADALFRTPIVVLSLVLFSLHLSKMHHNFPFFWPLTAVCLAMLTISNFPTAQPRGRIGAIIIAFMVIWFIHKRPRLVNWFPTIVATGLLVVFPLLARTRRHVDLQALNWDDVRRAYFQGSFDAYQMLGIILEHANTHGLTWGRQLLGAVFFWVPRSLWPDKPIGTGAQVATELGMTFTNLSAPLWAEAYIDFGVLGIVVAFFILGRVLRTVSSAFLHRGGIAMIFGSFFVGFQLFLLRGDLMSSFTFLFPFLAFAYVLFWKPDRVPRKFFIMWHVWRTAIRYQMRHAQRLG